MIGGTIYYSDKRGIARILWKLRIWIADRLIKGEHPIFIPLESKYSYHIDKYYV